MKKLLIASVALAGAVYLLWSGGGLEAATAAPATMLTGQVLDAVAGPGYTTAMQTIAAVPEETRAQEPALVMVDSVFATGLSGPFGITHLADGRVLVADYGGDKVLAFAKDGTKSDFATGLSKPIAITQLEDGRVLVVENGAGKVSAFEADGTGKPDFATDLSSPNGITQLKDGSVLVTEYTAGKVSAFAVR